MFLIRFGRITASLVIAVFDLSMLWIVLKFFPRLRCGSCGRADYLIGMKNGGVLCYGCRLGFQEDAMLRP